ncbi:MAG: cupin domain-containing protein [Candidatus Cloacimonas sp.]
MIAHKVWGCEDILVNEREYCFKKLYLQHQYRCSIHHHEIKKETFILDSGIVLLELGSKDPISFPSKLIVLSKQGDQVTILPGIDHRFTGIVDSVILEISTHDFQEDSIRSSSSSKITAEEFDALVKPFLKG